MRRDHYREGLIQGRRHSSPCTPHASISTDIPLSFFGYGSRPITTAGAYAVAFKCYAPGTEFHGCKMMAGWPIRHQSNNACELLAIKQALKVAILELTTLQQQLQPNSKLNVKVQIFSDSMFALEHLAGLRDTMARENEHVSSIHNWSASLYERFVGLNSPLDVKLQLLWVPGHVKEVTLHHKADELGNESGSPSFYRNTSSTRTN